MGSEIDGMIENSLFSKTYFLAVDIGNTHTVTGLFQGDCLLKDWRLHTDREITPDELAVTLDQLCRFAGIRLGDINDIIISCVVPPLIHTWKNLAIKYISKEALFIQDDIPVEMPICYRRPYELGADRLANAVAAYSRYRDAIIVVDYGTATTFDCVSPRGEYLGGSIAPGLVLAAEALFKGTSRLPRVELFARPKTALGQDTASAIQAGIIYGFAGLTEGIIAQLLREFAQRPKIIATGGLAPVMAPYCPSIEEVLPDLVLEGLEIIYRRIYIHGGLCKGS